MAIVQKWYGTPTAPSNSPAPAAGGSFNPGDAILAWSWENPGTDTVTCTGAAAIDANNNYHQVRLFAFISATGAEAMPTFSWPAGTSGNTGRAVVACYSGIDSGLAVGGTPQDRGANTTVNIVMPAVSRTPSVAGCLCLYYGIHKKTASTDGITYTPPSGTGFTIPLQFNPAGNDASFVVGEWIQTTATTIASGDIFIGSATEPSSIQMGSAFVILAPAAVAPNALLTWPKQTFVNTPIYQF